jgi:hypothetical protein
MPSYLIVSPHTQKDCVKVLQDLLATGYLTHFDWGCKDGDHTGWAIIDATSKAEAMMAVPPFARHVARVVQLTKFSPEEVRAMHGMK